MNKRISGWLYQLSKGWVTLLFFLIFILFTILVLPAQSASTDQENTPVRLPDLSFFYTPKDLYHVADVLGMEGRKDYIQARFTFDVVWPMVYTAFLATTLSWLLSKVFKDASKMRYGNLLPIYGALFDYCENIATSIVMARYPKRTVVIDLLASVFTPIKWICISISFVFLVYTLFRFIFQNITKARSSS